MLPGQGWGEYRVLPDGFDYILAVHASTVHASTVQQKIKTTNFCLLLNSPGMDET